MPQTEAYRHTASLRCRALPEVPVVPARAVRSTELPHDYWNGATLAPLLAAVSPAGRDGAPDGPPRVLASPGATNAGIATAALLAVLALPASLVAVTAHASPCPALRPSGAFVDTGPGASGGGCPSYICRSLDRAIRGAGAISRERIRAIHAASGGRCGSPRVHATLAPCADSCGREACGVADARAGLQGHSLAAAHGRHDRCGAS